MASSFLWTGRHLIATHKLRCDTHQTDPDIKKDREVLTERIAYEERRHTGLASRDEDTFWLEDN